MSESLIKNGLSHLLGKEVQPVIQPVSGGDINEAFYVRTNDEQFFMKLNKKANLSFFEFESRGLKIIQNTKTIDVPQIYGSFEVDGVPMLWLEWIEGKKTSKTSQQLGERLAALHLSEVSGFGFDGESYIGQLKQKNQLIDNWLTYYRDVRIKSQLDIGISLGRITGKRRERLIFLMEHMDKWIPENPKPSILHGDLWGGNWMAGNNSVPYLIDLAVLNGHYEFELAFTELFGGFSGEFYDSYHFIYSLSKDYEERKKLYQLYYLLVHLNMFGETYGKSVDECISFYL